MFFLKQKNKTYGKVINRVAVIVRAKQAFVDWSNRVSGDKETLDDFKNESVTYLFAVDMSKEIAIEKAEASYETIFNHHVSLTSEDPATWPQQVNLEMFRKWFVLEVSDMLVDLEEGNGIKGEFRL